METEEHLLGLKVMRLTRPTLASAVPITCDGKDLPGNLLNLALQQDPTAVQGLETIMTGQFLLLPQSPVNIYLGETFSSYVCVFNETEQTVKNVSVKVDLQTSSQRLPLSIKSPTPALEPNDTVNNVIHYEVKEIGTHILVCEVSYQSAIGNTLSFRKFFKIQVLKPLDVKTKFYNAESDDVYLEAQVQNITAGPICLEKVALDASHLFNVTSLNVSPTGQSIFGKITLLPPQASCQFLYCLSPDPKLAADLKMLSGATNIGKLDIVWRSNLGERGRLQTSQLQRIGPVYDDIRLTIVQLPNFVNLEELFSFKCKIFNNCERTVELVLSLEAIEGISWCGISGIKLDSLPSRGFQEIELKAIPLLPGLRSISGIQLLDTFLKRTYSYDDIAQIFVVNDKLRLKTSASKTEFRKRELRRKQKESDALQKKEALILAQIEEKRKKREEREMKLQQVKIAMEAKHKKFKQLEAEKEAKYMKQKEEMAKKRAAASKRVQEEKEKDKINSKHIPPYLQYETPLLPTPDYYDSDDPTRKQKINFPLWQMKPQITQAQYCMRNLEPLKKTFFLSGPRTPDLLEIFPSIQSSKLKRTSSAIWNKTEMSMLENMSENEEY